MASGSSRARIWVPVIALDFKAVFFSFGEEVEVNDYLLYIIKL